MSKNSIVILLLILTACYQPARRTSYSSPYKVVMEERKFLKCDVLAYSGDNDSLRLYFKIPGTVLQYDKGERGLECSLQISYEVHDLNAPKSRAIDSSTHFLKDVRTKIPNELLGYFNVKAPRGKDYFIELKISDLLSHAHIDKEVSVALRSVNSSSLFLNISQGEFPVFQPKVFGDSILTLSNANANKSLYVRYYNRNFGTAPPPFATNKLSTFSYHADSVFTIHVPDNGRICFKRFGNGFYCFQSDSTIHEGFTLFCFPQGYPKIQLPEQLLEPLLYICSRDEYATLVGINDTRSAVENFWISRSSSKERARHLIKQYYLRVEEANTEFTSYIEGWRTDRGMIHIIFGSPGYKQITPYGETWTYRTGLNGEAIHFSFRKVDNPFTDNDYVIERNLSYKPVWYNAVENWRAGRIFKLNQY